MTAPSLTITISRTTAAGGPTDLVLSGDDETKPLAVVNFQPAGLQSRLTYMPDSVDVDGSVPIAAAWQQAMLSFDFLRDAAASETVVQAAYLEVAAALAQFSFTVTTQVSGAPAQVWAANRGSIVPPARDFENLTYLDPVYAVTIPVYPIAGS